MVNTLEESVSTRREYNEGPSDHADEFLLVDSMSLRIGSQLRTPLYDDRGVLLLSAQTVVTQNFLTNLKNRCITTVRLHQSELHHLRNSPAESEESESSDTPVDNRLLANDPKRNVDEMMRSRELLGLSGNESPFAIEVSAHSLNGYDKANADRVVKNHTEALGQMADLQETLSRGQGVHAHSLGDIIEEAFSDLAQDPDFFACLGINPGADTYPARHSLHTSMLAMSIATRLGMDRQTMKALAMGCLIHDAGMINLDKHLYERPDVLSNVEFVEITKHPIIVLDLLNDAHHVPAKAAAVAYQIHERCNGSGYPRQREGNQIHVLARIAGIADTYVGLVSPRPHRAGFTPYNAIEQILRGTRNGLFEPIAVRALLHTTSLFPIGSNVELSDGRIGRVLRSNGSAYDRPAVEVWHPIQGESTAEIVDLLTEPHLNVRRALASLETNESAEIELADNWD